MEARQKQQDAFDARLNAQEEDQEEAETDETDPAENEETEEDENDEPEQVVEETPTEETNEEEISSPSLPRTKTNKDLKPPPLVAEQPSAVLPIAATESFPAFYRVSSHDGASVYRHEDDATAYLVTRVVPSGVILLGTNREDRTFILQKKSMIRMPDGWVSEDDVTRIAAVSLDSLLQQ